MGDKRVAGTIMLHLEDGSKKFLMHSVGESKELAIADFSAEQTGLANILKLLTDTVNIDVNEINLVELTNTHSNTEENIPLFVFETQAAQQITTLAEGYHWEEPAVMREVLGAYDFEGVPFF
ncbi:hypothetical protein BAU15_13585 [Enterococcus sp. JM4C]|uniref:hypothetical protein n=1 Tax=Candidatus Enterococcus huntleyi TaxID=1857217 RepID=UPI001379C7B1|nr:hypothetical protein [Enterococcus sp. JM4C]KAF1298306.1 hypothetical protein BAU15_13585 [Enterococcus sp. JM4C]